MTAQLSLPMPPAVRAKMPSEPILRSAEIERVGNITYRWSMTRAWAPARPCILWMPLNASDADGRRDDPTTSRMIGFSYRWGFGSMIVVNVYPFVSSTTDLLRAWRETWDNESYEANGMRPWSMDKSSWSAFHHNLGVASKFASSPEVTTCVAAWGAWVPESDVQQVMHGVLREVDTNEHDGCGMIGCDVDWYCLGKTANGAPIHPLARGRHRVPDDATLQIWRKTA